MKNTKWKAIATSHWVFYVSFHAALFLWPSISCVPDDKGTLFKRMTVWIQARKRAGQKKHTLKKMLSFFFTKVHLLTGSFAVPYYMTKKIDHFNVAQEAIVAANVMGCIVRATINTQRSFNRYIDLKIWKYPNGSEQIIFQLLFHRTIHCTCVFVSICMSVDVFSYSFS